MPTPGINLGLARITTLLTALRSPHLATPIIHIAGTNGKGSVSAYLSSILLASNLRVGRFNSPHLVDEWDCIEIAGRPVAQRTFEEARAEVEGLNEREGIEATKFEVLTATAFRVLEGVRPRLDLAVVEVGMGGRTDATNVVPPEKTLLSVVTAIELDHQHFLGDTIREIAGVKAGIAKAGGEVVLAKQAHDEVERVLEETADEVGGRVYFAGQGKLVPDPDASISQSTLPLSSPQAPLVSLPLIPRRTYPAPPDSPTPPASSSVLAHLPLPGSYQLANAAAATIAAHTLRTSPRILSLLPSLASSITDSAIRTGIEATRWPGRLDWTDWPTTRTHPSPNPRRLLIDGAHNPSSAAFLASYLSSLPAHHQPTTLVLGLSAPRPPQAILEPLLTGCPSIKRVCAVEFSAPAGMPWIRPTGAGEIGRVARELGMEVREFEGVAEALEVLKGEEERVVVAGSLYLAADVYRLVRKGEEEQEE